ncbi:hypothetical protein GHT06_014354 [Daphnia sinensis]|uniref:Uncharacterized protein n=1 Tax=Daphnia sinensis TaxID=1820382 RepID=A0AAD5KTN8_9CRUS|nr:hypothetical protein GHT06_014354 [Daphnia sinensis]
MALGIGDQFCLRWNNYHCNMTSVINQLLAEEAFVDVTLACDGARIKAHRVVLSACSPYFQRVLLDNPCKHPVLILPVGVGHADLRAIVEFIYRGETYVTRDQLSSIVRVAELLKIKGLCEVSQQQNETQTVGSVMSHTLPLPPVADHQSGPGPGNGGSYTNVVNDSSMTTVAASLGVPNNTVVSMATMTQPINQLISPGQNSNQRPSYSPSYRGRPRGRRPSGSSGSGRGGWTGNSGEKRNAAAAGLNSGGVRRPTRGTYRGSWPSRSPSKTSPTGSNQSTVQGSSSQDSVDLVQDNDSMMVQTPQSLQGNPGGGGGGGGGGDVVGYHGNPSASNTPVHSAPSSLDSQPQTTNLYDTRGYSSPVALDHLPSPWQHHLSQHASHAHNFSPTNAGGNSSGQQQDRSFKTEPGGGHGGGSEFSSHTSVVRNETVTSVNDSDRNGHDDGGGLTVTPEILGLLPSHITMHGHHQHSHQQQQQHQGHHSAGSGQNTTDGPIGNNNGDASSVAGGGSDGGASLNTASDAPTKKMYTPEAMEAALDALRNGSMSLTRAAAAFGIPSTTLWQRAHRLGIDTPMKKDPSSRHWSEDDLRLALDALRAGRISANRASKEYGIPSSTLYKIARKEGIKLAAPFNASPTTWSPDDLGRALEAIRGGMSVQRAATQFGIPSGTLYGRCKREGIELVHKQSYSGDRPWSDTNMTDAMEAVRQGEMSINQAAIHFNVPYSSLYNRIKRIKAAEEAGESYDAALAESGPPPDDGDVYDDDLDEDDPMMIAAGSGGGASGGVTPSPTSQGHAPQHQQQQQGMGGEPSPSPSSYNPGGHVSHTPYLTSHVPGHVTMTLPVMSTGPVPLTMDYQAYAHSQSHATNSSSQSSGAVTYPQ